jgi:hypothetical protein
MSSFIFYIVVLTILQNDLEEAIGHFLDCTCRLNIRWFNKPKFHVLLHLPAHICRFGPAITFATEGFESYNAIIRCASIHSNRHAPSKDIAVRMAKGNRVRHLLSGGYFHVSSTTESSPSKWYRVGPAPLTLLDIASFGENLLGLNRLDDDGTHSLAGT